MILTALCVIIVFVVIPDVKGGIMMQEKVLVCITIQENSRRLISQGFDLAKISGASLHILHIRKGETVFDNPESSTLLQDLFTYGGELGGEVHFLCSNDVTQTIIDFIIDNCITHLVLGEAPVPVLSDSTSSIYGELMENLRNIHSLDISVLSREDYKVLEA